MSYTVTIAEKDLHFTCEESQTILDAALGQGITIPYGCRSGMCGSCKGSVESGQITYPDGQPDGLDDDEAENGIALFCKATPTSDITIKVIVIEQEKPIEVKKLPTKVKQVDHLSDDVIQLILQLPAVEPFEFKAGQWIYFLLKDGKKRAFSIANSPNEKNELQIQIRHAVGGLFTDFVFDQMKVDDLLQIEGPHGTFFYQHDESPLLLVAGGTGFAPIKGIIEEIINTQDTVPPIHLFWGSRACKDLYQEELVQQWVKDHGISYTAVLSDPDEQDNWQGATGFVHQAVIEAYPQMSKHSVYMAGPPQMIESCKQSFIGAGLDESSLYYDSFEYSTDALDAMKGQGNG